MPEEKPKLLLHLCCAPCGGYLIEELAKEYRVSVFYDNPNIFPLAEFEKRRAEAKNYLEKAGYDFVDFPYDHDKWLKIVNRWCGDKERGRRCKLCYFLRLKETAEFAAQNGFDAFASTLAVSPHKDAGAINNIGRALATKHGINFLAVDWKKEGGYLKATRFSKEKNFYRQSYCGCEFSSKK